MSTNISFKGATLLSIEEAEQILQNILSFGDWWWLRSPGCSIIYAAYVYINGCVNGNGLRVDDDYGSVRPALQLNLESSNSVSDGTKLRIGEYDFTVVCNGNYALCDTSIGTAMFREDWEAEDANIYEASDVKKYINNWYENEIKDQPVECFIQMEGVKPNIQKKDLHDTYTCGQCGREFEITDNYCPDCGYRILWNSCRCLTKEDNSKQNHQLSKAQKELALKQMEGVEAKFHKGRCGKKYDYHTCGNCGHGISKGYKHCVNCGFKLIWKENKAKATKRQKTAMPVLETSMFDFFNDDIFWKPA